MGTDVRDITDTDIRRDLIDSHVALLDALTKPGHWWTSAERVAIAAEARRALDNHELPPWESPSIDEGMIGDDHILSPAAIDAIWRITNHPGTLTSWWHADVVACLPSPHHYVEMAGLVAMQNVVDRFASIVGLQRISLPEPGEGEPSRMVHPEAAVTTHWVPTTPGPGPNVLKAMSIIDCDEPVRDALRNAHYLDRGALLGDLDGGAGVPHGELLVAFVDAVSAGGDILAAERDRLIATLGEVMLVDVAAVVANFYMMTRIADSTGTPRDEGSVVVSEQIRKDIGVNDYVSKRPSPS